MSSRDRVKGKPRTRVAGVRLELLRAHLVDGDVMLTTTKAAELCARAQDRPTITRQLVELWAKRYGTRGEAWTQTETSWRQYDGPLLVSLAWLASFLERTGRAAA